MEGNTTPEYYRSIDFATKFAAFLHPGNWTTLTHHGSCLSSFTDGYGECDKCHWTYIPYGGEKDNKGKFWHFCPGCGRRIRHDIVKQCHPSGKCPHGLSIDREND